MTNDIDYDKIADEVRSGVPATTSPTMDYDAIANEVRSQPPVSQWQGPQNYHAIEATAPWLPDVLGPVNNFVNAVVHTAPEQGPRGGPIVGGPNLAQGLFIGGAAPSQNTYTGIGNALKTSPIVQGIKQRFGQIPNIAPAAEDVAATSNIQKLEPSTKEAQATAGRIANEALTRGSVPKTSNPHTRDFHVFRNLANSEKELQAAKASVPPGQRTSGNPLLSQFDESIKTAQTTTPPSHRWADYTTRSSEGAEYTPLLQRMEAESIDNAYTKALGDVRNRVAKLVDDSGQVNGAKLQDLKEQIDRDIYLHGGWKDTGTAAERANLAALREGNGYIRKTLEGLGNKQLNEANDLYSHHADVAKIVEMRRPDLEGLPNSNAKAARALTPVVRGSQQTGLRQVLRHPATKGAGIAAGSYVAGKYGGRILGHLMNQ